MSLWKTLKKKTRRVRRAAVYYAVRIVAAVIRCLPFSLALRIGAALGTTAAYVLPHIRRPALEHLRIAFGDAMPPRERARVYRRMFRHFGMSIVELVFADKLRASLTTGRPYVRVEPEDLARLQTVLNHGKGCIAICAHFGNWELMCHAMVQYGVRPTVIVGREINNEHVNAWIAKFREAGGVELLVRGSPTLGFRIAKMLKKNGFAAMLIDQNIDAPGVSVPFFGTPAHTPSGAAIFSARLEAPALVFMMHRLPDGGHCVTIRGPIPAAENSDAGILAATAEYVRLQEEEIRKYPELWVWHHPRWRRRDAAVIS